MATTNGRETGMPVTAANIRQEMVSVREVLLSSSEYSRFAARYSDQASRDIQAILDNPHSKRLREAFLGTTRKRGFRAFLSEADDARKNETKLSGQKQLAMHSFIEDQISATELEIAELSHGRAVEPAIQDGATDSTSEVENTLLEELAALLSFLTILTDIRDEFSSARVEVVGKSSRAPKQVIEQAMTGQQLSPPEQEQAAKSPEELLVESLADTLGQAAAFEASIYSPLVIIAAQLSQVAPFPLNPHDQSQWDDLKVIIDGMEAVASQALTTRNDNSEAIKLLLQTYSGQEHTARRLTGVVQAEVFKLIGASDTPTAIVHLRELGVDSQLQQKILDLIDAKKSLLVSQDLRDAFTQSSDAPPNLGGLSPSDAVRQAVIFFQSFNEAFSRASLVVAGLRPAVAEMIRTDYFNGVENRLAATKQLVVEQAKLNSASIFPELDAARPDGFAATLTTLEGQAPGFSGYSKLQLEAATQQLRGAHAALKSEVLTWASTFPPPPLPADVQAQVADGVASDYEARVAAVETVINARAAELGRVGRLAEFQQKLTNFLDKTYLIESINSNDLSIDERLLRSELDQLRRGPYAETEIATLEYELLRSHFVALKTAILAKLQSYEFNQDSAGQVDTWNRDVAQQLFIDLTEIVEKVPLAKKAIFEAERKRFVNEYGVRISYYMAVRSIKNNALGITDDSKTSQKDIALELPNVAPIFSINFDNEKQQQILRNELPPCTTQELRSQKESAYVVEIEQRRVKVFDPETYRYEEKTVGISSWGEVLRHLDLFFQGRCYAETPAKKRADFDSDRKNVYTMTSSKIISTVREYERVRLKRKFERDVAAATASSTPPPLFSDAKYTDKIRDQDILRAFDLAVFYQRHFVLSPTSFQKGAPGYYAMQPDYAMGETEGGTTDFAGMIYFATVGVCSPTRIGPDNDVGCAFTFDSYEVGNPHPETSYEKIAKATHPHGLRTSMRGALERKGLAADYDFLVDLPLLPIGPNGFTRNPATGAERGRYRVYTNPLSNVPLKDAGGRVVRHPNPDGTANPDNRIMTCDDLVDASTIDATNPNGSLMYELMPLETDYSTLEESVIWWIGQAANIRRFHSEIMFAKPDDFVAHAGRAATADQAKMIKYVVGLIEPVALETRYKENPTDTSAFMDAEVIKEKMSLIILLIVGVLMLAQGKTMEHVKKTTATFNIKDQLGVEAVNVCLEAGFSKSAFAKAFVEEFGKQIRASLRFEH